MEIVLLQKLAPLRRKQNMKLKIGFSSFFGFAVTYYAISQFPDIQFLNFLISLDLSFHYLSNAVLEIVLRQKLAPLRRKQNTKSKTMTRLFFIFWVRCNLFRDFSGSRRPIFKFFDIIRFVFPLSFFNAVLVKKVKNKVFQKNMMSGLCF